MKKKSGLRALRFGGLVLLLVSFGKVTWAEPNYCNPANFDEKEFSVGPYEEMKKKLVRVHAFKLGKVTLVGAGIGDSKSDALVELTRRYSRSDSKVSNGLPGKLPGKLEDRKFCTWYLNHPKGENILLQTKAANTFNHKDVPKNPIGLNEDQAIGEFMEVLENTFDREKINFLTCAKEENYIALGCNEMMHRGPTVFGMLLAFSGCEPEHALEITNQVWGLNGVKRKVRLAVIRKAYQMASTHPASRKQLQELFSEE